jgi:hypothetical protein
LSGPRSRAFRPRQPVAGKLRAACNAAVGRRDCSL